MIGELLHFFGSLICHQLPSRSIFIQGWQLPFCSRDTGIYTGVLLSWIYLLLTNRLKSDQPPSLPVTAFLTLLMLPMMVDAGSVFAGIRTSDVTIRIITGALFGIPLPFYIVIAANFKVRSSNLRPVIPNGWELIPLIFITLSVCDLILTSSILPWILIAASNVISVILLVGSMVYVLGIRSGLGKAYFFPWIVCGGTVGIFGFIYLLKTAIFP